MLKFTTKGGLNFIRAVISSDDTGAVYTIKGIRCIIQYMYSPVDISSIINYS